MSEGLRPRGQELRHLLVARGIEIAIATAREAREASHNVYVDLQQDVPDADAMLSAADYANGLEGKALVDFWDEIGTGDDGFYDSIRRDGCSSCGEHTPGCCDGCA